MPIQDIAIKALFINHSSLNKRLLLAIAISVALFFLDTRLDYFKPVRSTLSTIVYPLQYIASTPTMLVNWIYEAIKTSDDLREQITVLKAKNMLQSFQLQRMDAMEQENIQLRELLGSSCRLQQRVQVAELIRVDLDPFSREVIINKGSRNGVFVGQPVLDAKGVMGQVIAVSALSSQVMLLTDPNYSIPVQVNRNGLRAIVRGSGSGELTLNFLPHNADVKVNDLLVTSGLGGRFPAGYPVGHVMSINFLEGKAFATIKVKPEANLATSREVMLVLPSVDSKPEPAITENTDAHEQMKQSSESQIHDR